VHGANRLASNSLLEGMVFGPRAVEAIAAGVDGPEPTGAMRAVGTAHGSSAETPDDLHIGGALLELPPLVPVGTSPAGADVAGLRARLQQAMSVDAGVLRSGDSLARVAGVVAETLAGVGDAPGTDAAELRNLAQIAHVLVGAATARTESRGTHARTDHPRTDPAQTHRLVIGGGDGMQHFPGELDA
jgi:L-aspartate oxidase